MSLSFPFLHSLLHVALRWNNRRPHRRLQLRHGSGLVITILVNFNAAFFAIPITVILAINIIGITFTLLVLVLLLLLLLTLLLTMNYYYSHCFYHYLCSEAILQIVSGLQNFTVQWVLIGLPARHLQTSV